MINLRGMIILSLFLSGDARRSFRIEDSRHDAQQQDKMLAEDVAVSAEGKDAFFPTSLKGPLSRKGEKLLPHGLGKGGYGGYDMRGYGRYGGDMGGYGQRHVTPYMSGDQVSEKISWSRIQAETPRENTSPDNRANPIFPARPRADRSPDAQTEMTRMSTSPENRANPIFPAPPLSEKISWSRIQAETPRENTSPDNRANPIFPARPRADRSPDAQTETTRRSTSPGNRANPIRGASRSWAAQTDLTRTSDMDVYYGDRWYDMGVYGKYGQNFESHEEESKLP